MIKDLRGIRFPLKMFMIDAKPITVSLEWAKKLKEAGWPQDESYFYWCEWSDKKLRSIEELRSSYTEGIAAPTAEEILRTFPGSGFVETAASNPTALVIDKLDRAWCVAYRTSRGVAKEAFLNASIADAAAAMYCDLAGKKLLPS